MLSVLCRTRRRGHARGELTARVRRALGENKTTLENFFQEAKRVADGSFLWRRGDLNAFGALVTASGVSSVENYECGCAPMNALREIVCATRGVFGARFSGAGFRGCVVGLVDASEANAARTSVFESYAAAFPELARDARAMLAGTGDGARIIEASRWNTCDR